MRSLITCFLCGIVFASSGGSCESDQDIAEREAKGQRHHVTLFSGGAPVREWYTVGHPEVHAYSGSYKSPTSILQFMDEETKKLVMIRGTFAVEVAD